MRITSFGHSCLLVETDRARLLVDPGTYSSGYDSLTGIDAVVVTHQHPDHVDTDALGGLLASNDGAELLAEPEATTALKGFPAVAFPAGADRSFGDLTVAAVGGEHALIHDLLPRVGNVGLLIAEKGGPTLFHPGDSYAYAPAGVDVLAFPLNAPWARVSETLDFLRRASAPVEVPIHDGLLNDTGRAGYLMHASKFGPADSSVRDIYDRAPYDV
jgi:L-ascorbate metabolism protein UlaG (beta-lactamase superfamily)